MIRVNGDELDALHTSVNHPINRVAAAASDADHTDRGVNAATHPNIK